MRVTACGPHLVLLAEVDVDECADGRRVAEWRNAACGFCNW